MKFLAAMGQNIFSITLRMRTYAEYVDFLQEHRREVPPLILETALRNPDDGCAMFTKEVAEMMAPGCTISVA